MNNEDLLTLADCIIHELNKLLDPDWEVGKEPNKVIGYLAGCLPHEEVQTMLDVLSASLPEVGYLPVEPVQLKALGSERLDSLHNALEKQADEEEQRFGWVHSQIWYDRAISQATVAHNEKEQLYRVKPG